MKDSELDTPGAYEGAIDKAGDIADPHQRAKRLGDLLEWARADLGRTGDEGFEIAVERLRPLVALAIVDLDEHRRNELIEEQHYVTLRERLRGLHGGDT